MEKEVSCVLISNDYGSNMSYVPIYFNELTYGSGALFYYKENLEV